MSRYDPGFITLADLYRAYRKAKADAFFESSHFHALAFARYEQKLSINLSKLLRNLLSQRANWTKDPKFLGAVGSYPKSIDTPDRSKFDGIHFATTDPLEDWAANCRASAPINARFRQVVVPTVDAQVTSALWIIKVGHQFDEVIDPDDSYGNRLRRLGRSEGVAGKLNLECNGLFAPYYSGYGAWRRNGIGAMRGALENGQEIYAVTMDVKQFYHRVAPVFLLREEFLSASGIELSETEHRFTADFIQCMASWYWSTPDYALRQAGALPIGLSASKVISNVILFKFDEIIKRKLSPIYYGRYVDDIFLVFKNNSSYESGADFMRWMSRTLGDGFSFVQNGKDYSLKYEAPFAMDSEIELAGDKQKIFHLKGRHGLDLLNQISEHIRKQSSEHRLMPIIPSDEGEMLAQALLATPDSTLEPDALRKADTVSIRRLGFSLLLRDVEGYARDLKPQSWRELRHSFYGLVERHVLSPRGYFDYFSYVARVVGIMVACGDIAAARKFIRRFEELVAVIRSTTGESADANSRLSASVRFYGAALLQVACQASTVKGFKFRRGYLLLLSKLRSLAGLPRRKITTDFARSLSSELLLSDLGRRPFRSYWLSDDYASIASPGVPNNISVRRVLRLGQVRRFRKGLDLEAPYWPAMAFPTRPISIPEISLIAPRLLEDATEFRQAIMALRGAGTADRRTPPSVACIGDPQRRSVFVSDDSKKLTDPVIAVTSFKSTLRQWENAADGKPDRSLARYTALRSIVNSVLSCPTRPDYITFPELSLPRRWAVGVAMKLASNRVSMIAGIESWAPISRYKNEVLISLTTTWPGYKTNFLLIQKKLKPAHHEVVELAKRNGFMEDGSLVLDRSIYVHENFQFGVLVCSDLTSLDNRAHFQGWVDALFVAEWNQDLTTFGYLVDSASHDLHSFVIQTNNRTYGDSRIRGPFVKEYEREVVRVRGGEEDYFVIAKLRVAELRQFQNNFDAVEYEECKKEAVFKPLPIRFVKGPRVG